jgi:serine/threonine protein phosphatase PrpC
MRSNIRSQKGPNFQRREVKFNTACEKNLDINNKLGAKITTKKRNSVNLSGHAKTFAKENKNLNKKIINKKIESKTIENKKNYSYYESNSKQKYQTNINKNKNPISKSTKFPTHENNHSKFLSKSVKVNIANDDDDVYEYEGLSYNNDTNFNNNKFESNSMRKMDRFNSFNAEQKYNSFTFDIAARKKERQENEKRKNTYSYLKLDLKRANSGKIDFKIDRPKLTAFSQRNELNDNNKVLNKKVIAKIENTKIEEVDDDWDIDQYQGLRKKTLQVSRLKKNVGANRTNKLIEINSKFSTDNFIKTCQATSVAGKGEDGLKKINQDTYISERNINGILNFNLFGVLDGHGEHGHFVSQFVSRYIINRIKNHQLIKNLKNPKEIYNQLIANGYEILATIFIDVDFQVTKQKFNCETSGTTCVLAIQLEEHIICANVGDSRAILIFDDSSNNNLTNTKIYPLSYDCKPENPHEKQRIYECGGTVEQVVEEESGRGVGPFRVWRKGEEYPGLAMSRSIGDIEAKKIGVIPNPQIIEYNINYKSKYMLLCSDGIWEFISNEQAMNIGNKYYLRNDPNGLCHELTNKSTAIWMKEDITIDDITVVAVFF